MNSPDYPIGKIPPQPQTITIITPDNTLVDDPVKLVDDPSSLVGSLVTPVEMRTAISPNYTKGSITYRR